MSYADPNIIAAGRYHDAQGRRADRLDALHGSLRRELIDALRHDPARKVSTPGYEHKHMAAATVVCEQFAGSDGDELLHELLCIAGAAARGEDVQLRAAAWHARIGRLHADWHAGDAQAAAEDSDEDSDHADAWLQQRVDDELERQP